MSSMLLKQSFYWFVGIVQSWKVGTYSMSSSASSKDGDACGRSAPKKAKTPIGKLDNEELKEGMHPHQEKEPLAAFPDNTNPTTGEIGGPRGPEPTRYGDWERKGRVSDF
ncbi:unnamed protein product, partial [Meganyctiphanes norvegica]